MPPPDESSATRNGSVPSTRAISASARRRSTEGGAIWRASESAAGSSRERSCDRGLVMEIGSHQMLHDGRKRGGYKRARYLRRGVSQSSKRVAPNHGRSPGVSDRSSNAAPK